MYHLWQCPRNRNNILLTALFLYFHLWDRLGLRVNAMKSRAAHHLTLLAPITFYVSILLALLLILVWNFCLAK